MSTSAVAPPRDTVKRASGARLARWAGLRSSSWLSHRRPRSCSRRSALHLRRSSPDDRETAARTGARRDRYGRTGRNGSAILVVLSVGRRERHRIQGFELVPANVHSAMHGKKSGALVDEIDRAAAVYG